MLRKLLLFIVLVVTGCVNAQTMYWVGGSGYWNDPVHWSYMSGGVPANAIPSANSKVIFDNASSVSDFTIHALHSFKVQSIYAQNTSFKVDVIGSPNVDLTLLGNTDLNENFFLKLSGRIFIEPINSSRFNFSSNKFNSDIYVNTSSIIDLRLLNTSKSLNLSGNLTLEYSTIIAKDLVVSNSTVDLNKNLIQIADKVIITNSSLTNLNNSFSKIICNKRSLLPEVLEKISNISNITIVQLLPLACIPTLISFTRPTCAGACNGTAVFDLSGCSNSPYTSTWIPDPTTPCAVYPPADFGIVGPTYTVTNICGCGTDFTILFENSAGPPEQGVVTITGLTNPAATNLNLAAVPPTCNGLCNGQIRLLVLSGAGPFSMSWNPPVVTHTNVVLRDTLKNACAGIYTVTATNINGCVNSFTSNLTQPPPLTANGTGSSVTCNAVCNGSAVSTPSGGTAPYTYSWTSAVSTPSSASTSTIGNLCPGVVTMTVTDSKTCTATFSTTIIQPPAITLTVTKTDLNCGSICNGTASVTATGGIGPFTYSWSPSGGTAAQATGLCAGNYTCTVTNNGNCIRTITVSILSPPTLTTAPTQTNLACNGVCIGAININPSGGTPGYTYSWSPGPATTSVITNQCAGVYTYTVTDLLGCRSSNTLTITQPPATSLTVVSTNVNCFGACDGTAIATMLGGTGGYTYTWTPGTAPLVGQGTPSVTGLCPATYTVRSADANNCARTQTFIITQPIAISANVTTVSPTCNGVCNGSITSTPTGGTGPYSYTLQSSGAPVTSGPSSTASFTGLCAGSYTLLIRDALNCLRTQTINLTQPNPITLNLPFTPINCFNACNSTISTVVGGGSGPYTFTWSAGGTGNSLSNQCAGVHSATVTDSKGCQASATITITSLPDLTVSIVPTNPNCNSQCTGIATTTVTGGTPNYTINFSNGASGNIINNLCQGTYTATVIDFFGCTKTQTVAITAPPALTLTPTGGTVSCTGSCDGTVSVVATGGTSGYFYSWSPTAPIQTGSTANGLCAGNYIVSVTDALGCIASTVAAVAQPTVLTASIGNVQPSCNVCIGSATANGIGGTPPYTYAWAPGGQVGPTPNNLCVGIQTLTVTDSKNCTTTQTVQINQTVITLITTNGGTLNCNGACSGVATANPIGGLAPYSYTWTPAPIAPTQTTQTASGLCFGTHTVMVSDALGCSTTNTVTFTNPPAITLTVNQTNVSCNGACNGVATATAIGGTGIKSYLWQPGGQITPTINGLCAGSYTVTATDVNNCSQTQVVTITENSLLTATFTPNSPSTCTSANGTITAVIGGGLPTYTLNWLPMNSSANPLTNIGAGSYTLTVIDAAGCTQTISTTLSNPTGPTVTAVSNSITCFGACTGSATLTIAGTGPFSVNGSTIAANTSVLSGLCSGITTPIVMDGNSCVTNQTINIAQPAQLIANGVVTNDLCNASCTASINLTPSGGTLPYSFVWTPAGAGEDPSNLCAGNYTVDITDGNSCVTTNTYVITQPPALTLSFNKKDVLCNGQCTGGVRAVVGGGTSPYTYTWTPSGTFVGANIDTLVNVCSGIYTVSAMDVSGCIITGTIDIGQPVALTSTVTSINQKCFGQCNGSATITASGGVAPYSYNYNTTPITPTQTIGGLCIGTYTGGVSDANGCVSSHSFVITEPLPIVVTTTITNPTCNAVCNGSVATTVTGGNPNYSYNWIPAGGPVSSPTGLCAGNYTVIVTDDSLCTGQALVVLTDPAILLANTSFTNPSCNGVCNGVVTANPIGGTAPFSYSWASPVVNSQTVPNLCAGIYTLTLNDVNGCQAVQTVTLTEPSAITVNPSIIPATCGINNGSIDAIGASGIAPYTYNWLPPIASTNTLVTNLGAGIYTVIVTDAASCSATITIPLSNSNGPSGATITTTMVTCNSQCNGAAEVSNPVAGTAPYTLSWINPVSASSLVTGLCAGTYTAEIEDANNCLFFQSVVITEPQTIDDNEIIISAACLGNCNGSIALNPAGGNAGAYTYSWSPMAATAGTVTNLCPGAYTATITDVMGCTLVANYILPSLTTITSSTFATNNICFGNCNGTVLATNVAGGLPPYSFSWSDPAGQSTATASNLCNGNYSVTITDASGCFNVLPSIITSPSAITFTPTVTQPNCGLCDGSAIINPVGGIAGYTFVWTNGQTINTASNLCAGVYGVQITDANACVTNSNVVINNSSTITGETITQKNVTCGGTCDGTVTVTAIGGAGIITYHWLHDGSTTQSLTGLCAGTYFCNMTDGNGCTRTASVVIGATTNFTITPQVTQSSCSANTGSINVNVVGGTGSYNYTWIPAAANSPSLTNLAPGNYTLTVSDGNCSQTQVYSINSVNGPIVIATQNEISCPGICDGSISLIINGGTPAYTTAWSNGASTPNINGLCVGAYSYTVTDGAGCRAVQSFSLTTGTPVVFSVPDIDNPLCNNNCNGVVTTIPSGGALPYTYTWIVSTSTTSIANALCAGNYSVIVTDADGCFSQETYTLTGPPTISVTAVVTDANCNGAATGSINLTVTGGVPGPGYTYSWNPTGAVTEDITNLSAGIYSVTITDANGCNVDTSFVVAEPTAVVDNFTITPAACFGNCNGAITLAPTGGTSPYTYSWTPSTSNTVTATNLCPGPQTATITDVQGCAFVFNYNVPSLTTITASTLVINNLCFNDCNGVLTATTIAGGVAPYTVQWNDPLGQIGNTASGLCTGSYSATITDANGCFNRIPADVSSTSQVTFTPAITQPSCDQCNGSAIVNPIGGTAPYNFLWSNNQVVNTATNLCSGVYAVQITDGNGCVNTTNVVINSSSGITGETIVSTDVTCDASACDGSANVTAVGGVGVITYNWVHDNSTSQAVTGLCAGTYFCNMTDENGCSRTASVVIGAATILTISSQVTQSSCSSPTGSITVNVSGGTNSYTYVWLPAGSTPTLTNLAPGSYTLTVSDGNCSKTQIFTIQSINAPVITSTKKDISCSGVCDGNIAITITGGSPAYTTLWSNGVTTPSISALCAGAYSVEVTDVAGCKAIRNFSLSTVSPIAFSVPDLDSPQCHDACDGSLTAIPIGGTMPYTFTWTPNNVNTATTNSLCTGNYSITVADANGCRVSNNYSLINPPTLTLTATITDASCNTALDGAITTTVTGGIPPFTYNWTPGAVASSSLTNVLSGTYTLIVTDNFGCIIDSVLTINSTLSVNAIAGNDTLFCQNGTLLLDGSNSNSTFGTNTYEWFVIPTVTAISNSVSTTVSPSVGTSTYVLVATNGSCIDSDTIVVNSNALPIVDAGPTISIPLFGSGTIGGNPTCATCSLFSWSPVLALDNPTGTNPVSGTTVTTIYTVSVVDVNGCFNYDTVTVYVYPEIKIPNGFSPNGDGKNDVWQIDFIDQFPECEVEVYNRWGEQLFYSKGYAIPFNGQYKGKNLPVGTYYYVVKLNHPNYPNPYTSPLTIFR